MSSLALVLVFFISAPGVSAYPTANTETGGSGGSTPYESLAFRLFSDVFSAGNPSACPDLVWADAVITTPTGVYHGSDGMSQFVAELRAAFPDARFRVSNMTFLGDSILIEWVMAGTHGGAFAGIAATGTPVVLRGVAVLRVESGRVAEEWVSYDELDVVAQIGSRQELTPGKCSLCVLPE